MNTARTRDVGCVISDETVVVYVQAAFDTGYREIGYSILAELCLVSLSSVEHNVDNPHARDDTSSNDLK